MKILPDYVLQELYMVLSWKKYYINLQCKGIYLFNDYFNEFSLYEELYIMIFSCENKLTSGGTSLGAKYSINYENVIYLDDERYLIESYGSDIIKRFKKPDYFWTENQIKTLLVFS
jgi:hypothetical protein